MDSSNSNPTGIWSDGTVAWVADWDDTKLYAYNLSDFSRLADRDIDLASSNDHPLGIWGFRNTILVVDSKMTPRSIPTAKRTEAGSKTMSSTCISDNGKPWGIWGEGLKVWISDPADDMLYAYLRAPNFRKPTAIASRTTKSGFPADAGDVRSIWSDGEIMWALNKETSPLFIRNVFSGLQAHRETKSTSPM